MQAVKAKLSNISIPWRIILKNVTAIVIALVALSWLHLRPLGIFFLSLFFYWLYKTRCNFRIVPPHQLEKIFEFRKNQRKMFDVIMFSTGGLLALAGPMLITMCLGIFLTIVALILANCAKVEERRGERYVGNGSISDSEIYARRESESESDDEFLPDISSRNLVLLACASDLTSYSLPTEGVNDDEDDDSASDIPSELLIPDSIPELNENSTDDDDDLIPVVNVDELNADPRTIASKIRFEKCHFKSDSISSSSSSEENLSKGLNFTDSANPVNIAANEGDVAALAAKTTAKALLESGGNLLPALVTGLMQWGSMKQQQLAINNSNNSNALVAAVAAVTEVPKEVDRASESDMVTGLMQSGSLKQQQLASNNSNKSNTLVAAAVEVPKEEDLASESDFEFLDYE